MDPLKKLVVITVSFIVSFSTMAQEKKSFTLDDLIPGGATAHQFIPKNLPGLQWWGENLVWYDDDNERLTFFPPYHTDRKSYIDLSQINMALEAVGLKRLYSLYNVSYPDEKRIFLKASGYYAVYEEGKISWKMELPEQREHEDFCNDNLTLAYTNGNNLYLRSVEKDIAITDEPEGVVCGQSVHRNEFGIRKGTYWSPQGNYLAFYRMDERMVTDYPLVDISTRVAELKDIKYPMAGMTSHQVMIGIYDLKSGETIYLNTGDPTDRYFTNIAWSPDESKLYLVELNRDQNHAKLVCYDRKTGELERVLIEEQHPKYVEPQHPILFLQGNEKQFIWQSQRDGYNHLYLYDTDGRLIHQLTSGNWLVQGIVGYDKNRKYIYYLSTENSPLESSLYVINLRNNRRWPMGTEGIHQPKLSPNGKYILDMYSAPEVPRVIRIMESNKGEVHSDLLIADDPYKEYNMPSIEVGSIKAADGVTDLYYRLVKPVNFDPSKQYPAIVYVYGGPHNQLVRNGFNYNVRGWDIYMAQLGHVVFTLDNRGSMNRGFEFESVIFRQVGIEEGKDQIKGVEFLSSLPFVDKERIGVHGWSYGGHMTISLLLRYPGVFKVGVAGGPVIDWKYYEIMYGERYMNTPQTNPEGYELTNLNNLAGQLKDKLLVIHDDQDDTCVLQHTLSFMKACVEAYTFPDLFIYPGHGHNVRGRDRVHLHDKITQYFLDNL